MLFWIILSLIHFTSLIFFLLSLWQLWKYIRVYRLDEQHYELLLSFIHLRWICAVYGVLTILLIATSTSLSYYLW